MSAEGRDCCTLLPPIIIVIAAVTDETVNALIHERVLSFVCRLRLGEASHCTRVLPVDYSNVVSHWLLEVVTGLWHVLLSRSRRCVEIPRRF